MPKSKINYNHELIIELKEKYNGKWAQIVEEYSKTAVDPVNRKNIILAHSKWRMNNNLPKIKSSYNTDITIELVERYGNDWKTIHEEYCEMTKTNVNFVYLRRAYYRTEHYDPKSNKRKNDKVDNKSNKRIKA